MANILEVFSPETLLAYIRELNIAPFEGENLFPVNRIDGLDFTYIQGANNNLPVIANIHAFDTEADVATREGFSKVTQDLALIKKKIRINEKEIIAFNNPRTPRELETIKKKIFNDVEKMVMAVLGRVEAMRWEVISSGIVTLDNPNNSTPIIVDYGVPSNHKEALTGTAKWSDPAADPLADMKRWKDTLLNEKGVKLTRAVTSNTVLSALLLNTSIRKALFGVNLDRMMSKADLNTFLASQDLPQIGTYDQMYITEAKDGTRTTKRYLNESKFIMLPATDLGETIFGTTPEEVELANAGVELTTQDNVAIISYKQNDPVGTWTKATGLAMPSFPSADIVFQATVI